MSTDPQPVPSECSKCGKPSVQERPNPDAESVGQAAASSTPPLPSCRCCCSQEDSVGIATALERDSTDEVPMDIDNDLTTNERMPTVDELEQPKPKPKLKPLEVVKKEKEEKLLVEPAEQKPLPEVEEEEKHSTKSPRSPTPIKIEEEEEEKPKEKQQQEQQLQSQEDMPPSSPEAQPPNPSHRVGKITRSSLNGNQASSSSTRTPAIMKRLRKSTRFKAKPTGGRGNSAAAGNSSSQSNGHNNGTNNGASGSSIHLAGAGAHPSNTNKHGKSGTGGSGGGGGGSPAARSRRTLFKRPSTQKTPKVQASTRFVKSVFYKGSYMQIGDIVSIVDGEQNLYYAQIRGLLVDAYCEKSAFLTWLIPTQDSPDPQEGFDPATYLIGPDEELSRKLCYLEFVMHAPSNYYFDRSTPFPLPDVDEYTAQRSGGFIWTRLPVVKREKGEREREREMRGRDSAHKASGGAS
ncbi:hypothetical protein KR059_009433 [Drosophila kikkawai]|nr:hypothetical protein KR059_009433 [Drosophila kikkawai]